MTQTNQPAAIARSQRGMSLIGFIFLLVFVLFAVYIGIKLVPIYLNHMSVVSEIKAIAEEPGSANQPPNSLRRDVLTRFSVSYIEHVGGEHVTVERGPPPELVVEYQVETHLIGNIDAVVKFRSAYPLRN